MIALRTSLAVLVLGAHVVACGGSKEQVQTDTTPVRSTDAVTPPVAPVETAMPAPPKLSMEEITKKHVAEREAAWAAHDAKKATALFSADAMVGSGGPSGWEEMKASDMERSLAAYFVGFPDAKLTTTRVIQRGNVAVLEWVAAGTNAGELMGEKATGKKVASRGASVVWFAEDGKATREHLYMDAPTMLGQMGKGPKGQKFRAVDSISVSPIEWLWSKPTDDAAETSAKALYAAFARKDAKAAFAMFTDDVVLSNQYDAADVKGRKAVEKTMNEGMKAFADDKYDVKGCHGAAPYVACEYVWTATWKNAAMGMKPTQKTGTVHVLELLQMKDGKVQQITAYGNGLEFASTFGLLPDPKKGDKAGPAPAAGTTKDKATGPAKEPKPVPAPTVPPTPPPPPVMKK